MEYIYISQQIDCIKGGQETIIIRRAAIPIYFFLFFFNFYSFGAKIVPILPYPDIENFTLQSLPPVLRSLRPTHVTPYNAVGTCARSLR